MTVGCTRGERWFVAALLSWALSAGCGSPIVGAECRPGYVLCDGRCINTGIDEDHCGGCGQRCDDGLVCEFGECGEPSLDGGDGDGDSGASGGGAGGMDGGGGTGGRRDGGLTPIGTGGPFLPDGGFMFPDPDVGAGCPIGTIECSGACVNPNTSTAHCGGCGMACAAGQFCALGTCVDICEEPLSLCAGACVDYESDPLNCGSCGNVCQSGICEEGECGDVLAGHVIVVGHDYRTADSPMMRRIAGNSVFLASGSPVRTLVYAGDARPASLDGIRLAIEEIVVRDGRTWREIPVTAETLPAQLLNAQALLIPAQDNATNARLLELGQTWGLALTQFVARGGVIVLFETLTTRNDGTFQLLEPSGLFVAESRSEVSVPVTLVVDIPGVGVSARGTDRYTASRTTVSFQNVTSVGLTVVSVPGGDPVVIDRIVAP